MFQRVASSQRSIAGIERKTTDGIDRPEFEPFNAAAMTATSYTSQIIDTKESKRFDSFRVDRGRGRRGRGRQATSDQSIDRHSHDKGEERSNSRGRRGGRRRRSKYDETAHAPPVEQTLGDVIQFALSSKTVR